jgi:hypothetical protein
VSELLYVLFWIAVWVGAAWIVGLILQLSDLLNSLIEVRSAKDIPLASKAERRRVLDNLWSIAGGVTLAIVIGFGIDWAGRLAFDEKAPQAAFLVLGLLVAVALLGAVLVVVFMIRGDGLSYAVLRANLAEEHSDRIRAEQVTEFRTQLAQVDSRKRHIRFGLRDRAGLRPVRVRLDQVADDFAVVPPTGFGAIRAVRWKTANAYVWVGNPVRLLPSLFAVLVLIDALIAAIAIAPIPWPWFVVPVVAAAVSFLLALLQARVALAAKAAWHAVYQKQRLDAVKLIEDLEKSSRKGVTGLGDRVARALQILRDQQN